MINKVSYYGSKSRHSLQAKRLFHQIASNRWSFAVIFGRIPSLLGKSAKVIQKRWNRQDAEDAKKLI